MVRSATRSAWLVGLALVTALPAIGRQLDRAVAPVALSAFAPIDPDVGAAAARASSDPSIRRSRAVNFDSQTILGAGPRGVASVSRLSLELFDEVSVLAAHEPIDLHIGDTPYWFGRIEEDEGGYVLLVGEGGAAVGKISSPRLGLFDLVPDGAGAWLLRERDEALNPPCGTDHRHAVAAPDDEAAPPAAAPRGESVLFSDVLLVYTAQARMAAGGTAAMENLLDLALADANLALANSLTTLRLQCPGKVEVDYLQSVDMGTDLSLLRGSGDGVMDEVHTLRSFYSCDVVALVVRDTTNACGIGYLMTFPSPSFASSAFSVTAMGCLSNATLGHEIGHNIGCHHDRENAGGSGAYPYSFGWRPGGSYRTVMAYPPGIRVPHFSNPDVLYAGHPTGEPIGNALEANNAQSISNTASTVVSFYASYTAPPGEFSLLEPEPGVTTESRRPVLRWSSAEQANSYQAVIDDAPDFMTPVHISATTGVLEYTPPPGTLQPAGHYWWKVVASNPLGTTTSDPSASEFFTPNQPPQPFGILAPPPGASLIGTNPGFSWSAAVDADTYSIECDDDPDFSSPVFSIAGRTSSFYAWNGTPLLGLTTYYWRVLATNVVGDTPSTPSPASFDTIGVPPGQFSLLAPPDGPNVSTRTPTLEWSAAVQADSYQAILDDSNLLDSPLHIASGLTGTSYQVPSGLLSSNVRYYWRIVAENESGGTVGTPATQSFGVVVPYCFGDADLSGIVNFGDVVSVLSNWLTAYGPGSGPGDANNDLIVNFFDVQTVLANWQVVCP